MTLIIFFINSIRFLTEKTCLNHFAGDKFSNFGIAPLGAKRNPVYDKRATNAAHKTAATIGKTIPIEQSITAAPINLKASS